MQVTFKKCDGRRYFVTIERENGPALVPRFAPGYDDLMPHDLAHYLVEEHFGISLGVFGQLAAGGSGVFAPAPEDNSLRVRRTAQRIASIGRDDMVRSEDLVVLSVAEWERSIGRQKHKTREVSREVGAEELQAAVRRLHEMAGRWRDLQQGSSITLTWPRRLTFDAAKSRRGRRQSQQRASGGRSRRRTAPIW
jgi:hypothetical protein